MEICGVEFSNRKQYEFIRNSVESTKLEGFEPTKQHIEQIKNVLNNKMAIDDLISCYRDKGCAAEK